MTDATTDAVPTSGTTASVAGDDRPREVFIVCNTIDEIGGVQRWARRMAELFTERGHQVRLVGVFGVAKPNDFYPGEQPPYATTVLHPDRYGAPGRPYLVRRLTNPAVYLRYRRWQSVRRAGVSRLSALFAQSSANGVIVCAQVQAMEWVAQADRHGMPVIGISHESYAASRASTRYGRVRRYYAGVARFLTLTEEDATAWTRDGGMFNTGSMPNPLPFPADGGADPAAKVAVAVGRLSYEKGYDLLLDTWSKAAAKRPDWVLRIYGDGPERERLTEQAVALGMAESVQFLGSTNQVAEAMRGGSILVSASRAEGFPMTLLEAMACGLPCVAADCAPGVRELVRPDSTGFLAPPGNTELLAERLGQLMDDQEARARMGQAALLRVAAYGPEEILGRWEKMFALVHR
jgi:glycosyltransferase involved in cell wall biosynthesis